MPSAPAAPEAAAAAAGHGPLPSRRAGRAGPPGSALHVRRLPPPPRRRSADRRRELGLARGGAPLEWRHDPARDGAQGARLRERPAQIQKDFGGPRTIAFVNPKGGAAKTTSALAAGFTFGTVRGGGVVAWDNNETRGTLGIRGIRGAHRNTTRELLEDLGRFREVFESGAGDLATFVRSQGDALFDVLASDERPDVTGMIRADDFRRCTSCCERRYDVILVDTGNNLRAENWLAAAAAADLLVVTSTVREDTGYSGLWMLDALAGLRLRVPEVQDDHGALRSVADGRPEARPATSRRSTSSAPGPSTACPTTPSSSPARSCPTTSSRRPRPGPGSGPARGWPRL